MIQLNMSCQVATKQNLTGCFDPSILGRRRRVRSQSEKCERRPLPIARSITSKRTGKRQRVRRRAAQPIQMPGSETSPVGETDCVSDDVSVRHEARPIRSQPRLKDRGAATPQVEHGNPQKTKPWPRCETTAAYAVRHGTTYGVSEAATAASETRNRMPQSAPAVQWKRSHGWRRPRPTRKERPPSANASCARPPLGYPSAVGP